MSAKSDYLENKIIDHIFRGQAFTMPSGLYFALFTAAPSDSGGGTEVSGGAYARANLAPSLTNYLGTHGTTTGASSGTGGATSNASAVTFPAPSGANWGVCTHFGIFDASTSGNLLFHGALTISKTVNNGDPAPSFAIGDFDYTEA